MVGYSATIGVDPYSVVGAIGTLPGGLPRLEQGVRRCTAVRDLMTDGTPCIMESEDGASAGSASGFLDFNIGNGLEGQWNSPYGISGEPVTLVGKSDSQAYPGLCYAACVADGPCSTFPVRFFARIMGCRMGVRLIRRTTP